MVIKTLINQTSRPIVLNLAPVSDQTMHLPPNGRVNVLEEELQAYEVQGALRSIPPRLRVVDGPPAAVSNTAIPDNAPETPAQAEPVVSEVPQAAAPSTSGRKSRNT